MIKGSILSALIAALLSTFPFLNGYLQIAPPSQMAAIGIATESTTSDIPLSAVVYANQFPGGDAGTKIKNAIAALPITGGVVDARGLIGTQIISSPITLGSTLHDGKDAVELLVGSTVFTVSSMITLGDNSSIVGSAAGPAIGATQTPSTFIEASGANLQSVISLIGGSNALQDITVDGNESQNPVGGAAILINADHVSLFKVTAQHANTDGIEFSGTLDKNSTCCGNLLDVTSIGNNGDGLYMVATGDTMVTQSRFEDNSLYGVELNNSPALRIEDSDLGGNHLSGMYVYGQSWPAGNSSSGQIITGNQFGNNYEYDIDIDGTNNGASDNLISNNSIISSTYRSPDQYDSIYIYNSGNNIISNNYIQTTAAHAVNYGVRIDESSSGAELGDNVVGNIFIGPFTKAAFIGTKTTNFADDDAPGQNSATTPASQINLMVPGRVGIGTTTPDAVFEAFRNISTTKYANVGEFAVGNNAGGSAYSRILIGQGSTNTFFLDVSDQGNIKGNLLLQPWGGDVDIGGLTPQSTLQVTGHNTSSTSAFSVVNLCFDGRIKRS